MRVYVSSSPKIIVFGSRFLWMVVRVTKMKSCPILLVIKTIVTLVLMYGPVQNSLITQSQWPLHVRKCQQPFFPPWIFIDACFYGGLTSSWRRHTHNLSPWVRLGTELAPSDQLQPFWRSPESRTQNAANNHEKKNHTHMLPRYTHSFFLILSFHIYFHCLSAKKLTVVGNLFQNRGKGPLDWLHL